MPESAEGGGEREARDSSGQPLDRDDLPSVTEAHALRKVVVEAPQRARTDDKRDPRPSSWNRRRLRVGKRKQNGAHKDGKGAQPSATSQVLAGEQHS